MYFSRSCFLFILLLAHPFLFCDVSAQSAAPVSGFDSTFNLIATEISSKDAPRAILMADTLLNNAVSPIQKVKSYMLLARLYESTGDAKNALVYAIKGEQEADLHKIVDWQVRISGFLSTTFRNAGLISEGRKYLQRAEITNKNNGNSPLMQMFIHQEKAYYEIEAHNWKQSLEDIEQATIYYRKKSADIANPIFEATNLHLRGICHIELKEYDSAAYYLSAGLQRLQDQESVLKGFIYQILGELYIQKQEYDKALPYLDSALLYTYTSDNFNLKIQTYKSLCNYYQIKGNDKKALLYQQKYTDIMQQYINLSHDISNALIDKYDLKINEKNQKYTLLFWVCIILAFCIFLVLYLFTRYTRRQRIQYLAYIKKIEEQKEAEITLLNSTDIINETPDTYVPDFIAEEAEVGEEFISPATDENNAAEGIAFDAQADSNDSTEASGGVQTGAPNDKSKAKTDYLAPETVQRILKSLSRLEQQKFYLKNDVSLAYCALRLKVNTKYLSFIINKYKQKDFNNYINELRINYIIDRLRTNPEYLEYKVAYLAQECGFSSHSKFAMIFKAVTGLSPSSFIKNIKEDDTILQAE